NEFYGALGVGSVCSLGRLPGIVPLMRFFLDLRISAVIRQILKVGHAREGLPTGRNVMNTMAAEREIHAGSPLRQAAESILESNLCGIIRLTAAEGVPVLLCEVSSNLRSQPPFDSAHPTDFPNGERFDRFMRAAARKDRDGDLEGAYRASEGAVDLDGTHAAARFLKARILDELGRERAALREYVAARDFDIVPFRAPSGILRVIRSVAGCTDVPLIAIDSLFMAEAAEGIPGDDFFLEHLHLSLRGNYTIAEFLARRIFELGLVAPQREWRLERKLSLQENATLVGVTSLDLEIGDQRVHMLKQKWPYRRTGDLIGTYVSQGEEKVIQLARAVIRKKLELNDAHSALADYYLEQQRKEDALAEYLSSFKMFPFDPHPARQAGRLLFEMKRTTEARRLLTRALALQPASEATLLLLGQVLAAGGEIDRASLMGRRALQLNPRSQAARAFLDSLRRP
ncbi:MAG: tetratricopeptide repeat protein, partial [Candidatus Eisenbacteria sp.]|nr:tetratricopeptide repeat protein [Candidatus Eisenbacteria bacterium]